jgi:hypothetical protein
VKWHIGCSQEDDSPRTLSRDERMLNSRQRLAQRRELLAAITLLAGLVITGLFFPMRQVEAAEPQEYDIRGSGSGLKDPNQVVKIEFSAKATVEGPVTTSLTGTFAITVDDSGSGSTLCAVTGDIADGIFQDNAVDLYGRVTSVAGSSCNPAFANSSASILTEPGTGVPIYIFGSTADGKDYVYNLKGVVSGTSASSGSTSSGSTSSGSTSSGSTSSGSTSSGSTSSESNSETGGDGETDGDDYGDTNFAGEEWVTLAGSYEGKDFEVKGKSAGNSIRPVEVIVYTGKSVEVKFAMVEVLGSGDREVWLVLPKEMIDGINMVQISSNSPSRAGENIQYEIVGETFGHDARTSIKFVLPEGTDSVEILGTMVVPEFTVVLIPLVLFASILSVLVYTRFSNGRLGLLGQI